MTLQDGFPCFFADFGEGSWPGYNLTVVINKGTAAGLIWAVSVAESAEKPSTPQSCVQYGQRKEAIKTVIAAAPLHDGLPYLAIIHLGDRARYGIPFCMGKDAQGSPALTRWNENGDGCTAAPLNEVDKPTLLWRLFGK